MLLVDVHGGEWKMDFVSHFDLNLQDAGFAGVFEELVTNQGFMFFMGGYGK